MDIQRRGEIAVLLDTIEVDYGYTTGNRGSPQYHIMQAALELVRAQETMHEVQAKADKTAAEAAEDLKRMKVADAPSADELRAYLADLAEASMKFRAERSK